MGISRRTTILATDAGFAAPRRRAPTGSSLFYTVRRAA
jgi:hypothetical protein